MKIPPRTEVFVRIPVKLENTLFLSQKVHNGVYIGNVISLSRSGRLF